MLYNIDAVIWFQNLKNIIWKNKMRIQTKYKRAAL